jgi:hypothetical protein
LKIPATLLCLAALCHAQSTYAQAPYINTSQFFAGLKEVSLDLRSTPSLTKFVSLPAGWSPGTSQPFGGDLPGKSYRSPSEAHGELWIAHSASGPTYELHFQVISAPAR